MNCKEGSQGIGQGVSENADNLQGREKLRGGVRKGAWWPHGWTEEWEESEREITQPERVSLVLLRLDVPGVWVPKGGSHFSEEKRKGHWQRNF